MVKAVTEDKLRVALAGRNEPLSNSDVDAMCADAGCSRATFYRSAAVAAYLAALAGPQPKVKATAKTRETMTKLRQAINMLANIVQNQALRIKFQDQEIAALRQRADANVVAFPKAEAARRGGGARGQVYRGPHERETGTAGDLRT